MTKLAIVEEREEDKWEHHTAVKCWKCDPVNGQELRDISSSQISQKAQELTDGVMKSLSSARQSEVKAWEEEIEACEHTLLLEQEPSVPIEAAGNCSLLRIGWVFRSPIDLQAKHIVPNVI